MNASGARRACTGLALAIGLTPGLAQAQIATLAPQVHLSHSLGNIPNLDPLVDPNTFFIVGANQTKTLPIDILSVGGFGGDLALHVRCCTAHSDGFDTKETKVTVVPDRVGLLNDYERVASALPPWFSSPKEAIYEQTQFARVALQFETPSNLSHLGETGTFLARVDAYKLPEGNFVPPDASTYVVFSVIDIRPDNTSVRCASSLAFSGNQEVLPLAGVTQAVFDAKAANPSKTRYALGLLTSNQKHGWQLDIEKPSSPIGPDQIEVVLVNPTNDGKSLWTYTSTNCARPTGNIVLNAGDTGSLILDEATSSTIVLSDFSHDYGVLAEPNFWTLFGGRKVTITVIQ